MPRRTGFKEGTYYARNRARILAALRHKRGKAEAGVLWKQLQKQPWYESLKKAKRRAAKRGLKFDLTPEWARARWTGRCEITGIAFEKNKGGSAGVFSPSLDRIDNTRGYTQDNCRYVIHAVNVLKFTGTDEQMIMVAQAIVRNAAPVGVRYCAKRKGLTSQQGR